MIIDLDQQINNYCRFCNPQEPDRILYESKNFYIMLSLGPIVEGYTLLVSKKHIGCCGEIPSENFDEFVFLYGKIKEILEEEYGSIISYEHGKAGSCLIPTEGSKHCFHSHMHFVPVKVQLNDLVQTDYKYFISGEDLYDFRDNYEKTKSPYLFVDDSAKILYPNIFDIRSQYLRHKVATAIGEDDLWDWVQNQGWDKITKASIKLKPKFSF